MSDKSCKVCDGERVVALGTGPATDLFPCPACVGLDEGAMFTMHVEDAVAMCEAEGVPVKRWSEETE